MGTQVTISASAIDKQRLGYQAISLTNFTNTSEPSIAAGSKVEIGGALYEFTADETGTGWAGIGASNNVYILLTPSGASVSWSYTTTAPTWSESKQGFYTGSNRVVAMLYKDAGGNYVSKSMLGPLTSGMGRLRHLPMDNTVNRSLGSPVPAAEGNWYASAITGRGVVGVPSIALGVRVRMRIVPYATASGAFNLSIRVSDNNSNTPTEYTAHPGRCSVGVVTAGGVVWAGVEPEELDIPLNSSGQFYMFTLTATNITVTSSSVDFTVVGFYIGD